MDTAPTIEAIENAASRLERAALELRAHATRMEETGDLTYAAEAMGTITNLIPNLRLDLFVTRPLRAMRL